MRTVTYGAACSVDGFITAKDEAIDWLHFSKDVQEFMATYWKGIDTILMGRKTWDFAVRSGGGGGSGTSKMRTYVFSRTLTEISAPGATLVRENAADFVRQLKRQEGKEICLMGGSDLARSLFANGLVDEVRLNMHPILLGSGTPLFHDTGGRIRLDLAACRQIDGGCLLMTYRVRH